MNYDFDTLAGREGIGNMKSILTSPAVSAAGLSSFEGAEMDFKTAPCVIDAMVARAQGGIMGFTLATAAYTEAIRWWMKTQRGVSVEPDWIVPTHGTIHSVATAIRLLTREGEAIIVQPPVYNRYEQAAQRLNRRTLYNTLICDDGRYTMDFENLERLMRAGDARLFILCNPHNPIGRVWRKEELTRLAALSARYNVTVFSDEIFAEVNFGQSLCPCYLDIPLARERAIVCTSLGKAFSFTGVNHANALIADDKQRGAFIEQRNRDHYGSMDPIMEAAVRGAYTEAGAQWKDAMVDYVRANLAAIDGFFKRNLPQVRLSPAEGGYILWMDWRALGLDEDALQAFLLTEAHLQMDAGSHYGKEGTCFTRMCVASPRPQIERALDSLLAAARARGFTAE